MRPIASIDRPIPSLPARAGSAIGDAFALLLGRIGGESGDGEAERQPAAPGGKRLPVVAIDPALVVPPVVTQPVEAPPLAPPSEGARAVPVAAPPAQVVLPDAIAARIERLAIDPDAGEARVATTAPDGPTAPVAIDGTQHAPEAALALRRAMPGEHAAPVVPLSPPRPPEAVVAALAGEGERDNPRDAPAAGHAGEPQPLPIAADPVTRPVAAAGGGEQPRLDTRDDRWMQGMIDHIETLRDAGGATGETRIRLSPDALGTIDIVLHHGDDGVQLRFASDNADAARLLADAGPRLTELAQQRGVRLAGMQVDVGGGQGSRHRDDPPERPQPPRPPSPAGIAPADPITDDIRIA